MIYVILGGVLCNLCVIVLLMVLKMNSFLGTIGDFYRMKIKIMQGVLLGKDSFFYNYMLFGDVAKITFIYYDLPSNQ